ncbi:XLF-domain-containing protein [Dothidotthia symphoricarpi CBS 119687]|uniref:Non-homologous end-joining factor 1 n=1 Tax=Dothidotthia symphoricarpi CBS 119687 TaxID=1392245 RepID=A0A6A5ZY10_9PLEO|nr:XLF-domain-containing protein [Dothidotthia symphoricarpi CBS 119687]KAF2124429.1 XLF-domain-containing protein [Dothidotthia symphoricarpi CBS 119687]
MSCWRVLELSKQPDDEQIPQLLVKSVFQADSYILHITDLTNIWSEELDLEGIVDRASREQSPIEVSKHDTTQLAILLDNIKKSLENCEDAICRITRDGTEGITLHSTVNLPKPLDSLTWKFRLHKKTATALRNELILPLLVSSHIQNERINDLVFIMTTKDSAIDRLVEQYESSNLDLAAAFPSIGRLKAGRRTIKREQAARHIPALQTFREDVWRKETGRLEDSDVTTLGMFQEALSQCNAEVPPELRSSDAYGSWWTAIPNGTSRARTASESKAKKTAYIPELVKNTADSTEDETDDDFEIHEHFRTRKTSKQPTTAPDPTPLSKQSQPDPSDAESTEDDDDLDAPAKSPSLSTNSQKSPLRAKSATPEATPPTKEDPPSVVKLRAKGFRIGGQAKKQVAEPPSPPQESGGELPEGEPLLPQESMLPPTSQIDSQVNTTPKKPKRTFKIGGKGKAVTDGDDSQPIIPNTTRLRSPTIDLTSSPPPNRTVEEPPPVEEVPEETPEEKAERRRAELKRRNEEAAKKQAQTKKKKRF